MNQREKTLPIPDVQSSPDTRRLAIDRVGIKAIRHPVKIQERTGGLQHPILGQDNLVAHSAQQKLDQSAEVRIVINDQNSGHNSLLS